MESTLFLNHTPEPNNSSKQPNQNSKSSSPGSSSSSAFCSDLSHNTPADTLVKLESSVEAENQPVSASNQNLVSNPYLQPNFQINPFLNRFGFFPGFGYTGVEVSFLDFFVF